MPIMILQKLALNWNVKYDLEDMMQTAWDWEIKIKKDEELINAQNHVLN